MGRICRPLRALGAVIEGTSGPFGAVARGTSGRADRELPPLTIGRGTLRGGTHRSPVASAQVKSALLLAGVCGGIEVEVIEPATSRDHSERMLTAMGARIERERAGEGQRVRVVPGAALRALDVEAPGDISSAAFLLAAAAVVDGSRVVIRDVGLNATRTGLLEIVEELGGDVRVSGWREEGGEPVGDLTVTAAPLRATRPGGGPAEVGGAVIPRLIDELVVLAALAARADGVTVVRDAGELRHKESDRIAETARLMAAFGVEVEVRGDGFVVRGPQPLRAATLDVSTDHRIALTAAVLALAAPGTSVLDGFEVAEVSFPELPELLVALGARVDVDRVGPARA
jgi:3-phosphoshikimate 1-carboxyvinyltransferase